MNQNSKPSSRLATVGQHLGQTEAAQQTRWANEQQSMGLALYPVPATH